MTFFINVPELPLEAAWIEFDPPNLVIPPRNSAEIRVTMRIPREAVPGDYRGLLRAFPVTEEVGEGVSVTVAVGATLLFTVIDKDFHFYDPLVNFYTDGSPFTYAGTAAALLVLLILLVRSRTNFRIRVGVSFDSSGETRDRDERDDGGPGAGSGG